MQDNLPLPLSTKVAYGFGAVAYGVKDNAFSVFLLFFYSRVVGMPAEQVGLAIMLVLIIDGICSFTAVLLACLQSRSGSPLCWF